MMKIFDLSKWKIRPLLYSLSITIGLFINILSLENNSVDLFIVGSLVLYLIISFEQYITANHYQVHHRKNSEKVYDLEEHKYAQYLHHLAIPSLLYFSLVSFIYFFQQPSIYFLILIITFILFGVLFENIYSFYRHKFSLLKSTNYIYDVISIIIIFFITGTLFEAAGGGFINEIIASFIFGFINIFVLFLFLVRHFLTFQGLILSGIYSVFTLIVFYFFTLAVISSISVSVILSILFAIFLHALSNYNRDGIDKDELVEYLILLLLISALVYVNVS